MSKKEKSLSRPDVQVTKTSRWTFHSTPFLLLTFHHTTYHSGDHNSDHAGENFDEDHAADNVDEDHATDNIDEDHGADNIDD